MRRLRAWQKARFRSAARIAHGAAFFSGFRRCVSKRRSTTARIGTQRFCRASEKDRMQYRVCKDLVESSRWSSRSEDHTAVSLLRGAALYREVEAVLAMRLGLARSGEAGAAPREEEAEPVATANGPKRPWLSSNVSQKTIWTPASLHF